MEFYLFELSKYLTTVSIFQRLCCSPQFLLRWFFWICRSTTRPTPRRGAIRASCHNGARRPAGGVQSSKNWWNFKHFFLGFSYQFLMVFRTPMFFSGFSHGFAGFSQHFCVVFPLDRKWMGSLLIGREVDFNSIDVEHLGRPKVPVTCRGSEKLRLEV